MKRIFLSLLSLAALFSFNSCEDVPMPYDAPGTGGSGDVVTIEPTGDGTAANPYNITALNEFAATLASGENSNGNIYFTGTVSQIKEISSSFGNATFYLSDDGTTKNQFYVYRSYGLDNKKVTDESFIQIGDVVTVCGQITNYNGTLETVQNKAWIVSINGEGGDNPPSTDPITGDNLLANGDFEQWDGSQPVNWKSTSTASNATLSQSTEAHGGSYAVKVGFSADQNKRLAYKELTLKAGTYEFSFYAKSTTDAASQCQPGYVPVTNGSVGNYSYMGYESLTNTAWKQIKAQFTLDATTTVCLVVMNPKTSNYATAQEILIDDAALMTNDGGLADGSGDDPVTPAGEPKGDGTLENPFNAIAANNYASSLAADTPSDKEVYIKGIVSRTIDISTQYKNATFYISDDGKQANEFYVFRCKGLGGADIASATEVKVGDEVVIYGKVVNYKGNTPETVQNDAYIYSINNNGGSDEENPGGDDNPPASDFDQTITAESFGLDNSAEVGTKTVSGVTFECDGGGNSNAPKYYNAGKNIRMYPKNTMKITAEKNIKSITLNCDTYSGIICVAEGFAQATPGTVKTSGNTITISGIDAKSVTLTNGHTGSGTASQIRVISFGINYAE